MAKAGHAANEVFAAQLETGLWRVRVPFRVIVVRQDPRLGDNSRQHVHILQPVHMLSAVPVHPCPVYIGAKAVHGDDAATRSDDADGVVGRTYSTSTCSPLCSHGSYKTSRAVRRLDCCNRILDCATGPSSAAAGWLSCASEALSASGTAQVAGLRDLCALERTRMNIHERRAMATRVRREPNRTTSMAKV